jgi:hypothetical protein
MYRILLAVAVCGAVMAQQPSVGVFLDFETSPPAALLEALRTHADNLLRPTGIVPAWRLLRENKGNEMFSDVFIVRFKGGCNASASAAAEAPDPDAASTRLGATMVRGGHVLPWAEVQCDAVKQGVQKISPRRRALAFSQALAKVVTHELYHLLADTTGHGRRGLTKAALRWDELTRDSTRFRDGDMEAYLHRHKAASKEKGPPKP